MIVGGIIILLIILGLFLESVTMPPRSDSEWQKDTDDEVPTTSPSRDEEKSAPIAA